MDRSYLFRVLDQLIRCHRLSSTHINNSLPRITLPQKMVQKVEKAKERKELLALQKKRRSTFKSPLVISCKREQFNHHKGQTYSGFDPKILASHGWKNKQSAGDHFTLVPYSQNPALNGTTHPNFTEFELHSGLQKGLDKLGYTEPTHIQAKTIPAILEGDNVLCAAETGSGKTLAYLLPALEMIHHQKLRFSGDHPQNCPRTIILTPSRELTDQILDVCQRLCEYTNIQPYAICGGRGTKHRLAWSEKAEMDILMATPGVLRKFLSAGLMKPGFLQHVILDEADSLLDDSFSSEVMSILQKLRVTASSGVTADRHHLDGTQFTLVGATIPRGLEEKLGDTIAVNSLHRVTSDHVHYLMPHVPQTFLRLKPSQKAETIVQLARKNQEKGFPTLIFSNRSETSFWLSELLRENSIPNVFMNAAIQEKRRSSLFRRFQSGEIDVLVATDIASRGLDLLRVHHVINFDFPPFVSDYIHRAGRVGRVGSHTAGQVTTFITKKWEVDLLWQIETAARKHQALHNVNANIKRKISSIIARKFPHRDVL